MMLTSEWTTVWMFVLGIVIVVFMETTGRGVGGKPDYPTKTKGEVMSDYPVQGFAPGNYVCLCMTCNKSFKGDERAIQCIHCASIQSQKKLTECLNDAIHTQSKLTECLGSAIHLEEEVKRHAANADYWRERARVSESQASSAPDGWRAVPTSLPYSFFVMFSKSYPYPPDFIERLYRDLILQAPTEVK